MSTRKRRLTDQYLTLDDLQQRERVLKQAVQLVFSHAFVEETVLWPAVRASGPDGEELTAAAVVFPEFQFGRATDPSQPHLGHSPRRVRRLRPPATRARACARRGPLDGTREWIARCR
ncbi:hypothetical protein ACF09J_30290 [Streptomyces sp. NPDC014889]|uniref:hypothetical protein n=1 Tax=Streptomyces sp. NPDC014889 TaxID=3364928 RepID=UPI0036F87E35